VIIDLSRTVHYWGRRWGEASGAVATCGGTVLGAAKWRVSAKIYFLRSTNFKLL